MQKQIKRLRKHKEFMQRVKRISRIICRSQETPFPELIKGLNQAGEDFEKLNDKWQRWVGRRVEMAINEYNKPRVLGRDGQWYSNADMDSAMVSGI